MPCLTGVEQPTMDGEDHFAENGAESSSCLSKSGLPLTQLRTDLLDFLVSNDQAHFKCQHKDDPELSQDSKRKIAEDLLDHSPAQFLNRFGQFLQKDHLKYFTGNAELLHRESYEIAFHLKELERFYCKATHSVDVKNRRYDALQKMIAGGSSYFSEDEMRQRNPYLYEQLVGQYLTEEERKERETPDLENISFVNLLLVKISKDETKELKNQQEKEENGEQADSSPSSDEDDEEMVTSTKNWNERSTWGETSDDITKLMNNRKKKKTERKKKKENGSTPVECAESAKEISDDERLLLMQEFVSTMYNSFIDGKDTEFDYSLVDYNPEYDCVGERERDEEEKYFDAETPEDEDMEVLDETSDTVDSTEPDKSELPSLPSLAERRKAQEEEEDTLDAFMKTVSAPGQTSDIDLTAAFQNLSHQSRVQQPEMSRVIKKSHVIKINLKKN
ncbi:coiled-coil domain-containing protein 97 [Frankliniella occidentalis]|uniref:Coiled-coil domain-containing protein 97 n=1 Tax=Frankliniella occidentalis TaxID=133901 RepID=A0A6J1TAY6_FRAOC|nr:coiled-coil domain-containing protein 97 [Frankliniella occidentalis]